MLIKLAERTDLVVTHEVTRMKTFIIANPKHAQSLVNSFLKAKSLDGFKENFRGKMGVPRTAEGDSSRASRSSAGSRKRETFSEGSVAA